MTVIDEGFKVCLQRRKAGVQCMQELNVGGNSRLDQHEPAKAAEEALDSW